MIKLDLETRTIWVYGAIEENGDFSAENIIKHLDELGPGDVAIRMNSDGGSVTEGWAIYNAIKRHDGEITTIIDSVAASMASLIFLAGDVRLMTPRSLTMIHCPYTVSSGNKSELRKSADRLEFFENGMENAYLEALAVDRDELREMLEAETWFNASEAVAIGLATGIERLPNEAKELI